ncbi:MAG: hypothetical protein GF353_11075, partial [Candidatus Lokiarchaeota archaeon]|nr:hypothetical protein [Candidatus Lokiarchaeota archaeon]
MSKIVVAIFGEGKGHATRGKVIIDYLISQKHDLLIVTSKNAYKYLKDDYREVIEVMGFGFDFGEQKINIIKTLQKNINTSILNGHKTLIKLTKLFLKINPDLIITDFEPFSPLVGKIKNIPFLSITNMHIIPFYKIDYLRSWFKDYLYTTAVINNMYIFSKHYFITSFYFPQVKKFYKKKTTLIKPIIRKEIVDLKPKKGNKILAYLTK